MGRKLLSTAFFLFLAFSVFVKSHDVDDADVTEETGDDPILDDTTNVNVKKFSIFERIRKI